MAEFSTFISRLKTLLPEESWPWVFAALRQDALIWQSLHEEFGERALGRAASRPEDWSPAALALFALEIDCPPEAITMDESLRRRARQAYDTLADKAGGSFSEKLTLSQAGLLGLALYDQLGESSWDGLPLLLSPLSFDLWKTPLAILFGVFSDPASLLEAFLYPTTADVYIDLALHALSSNPLPPATLATLLSHRLTKLPLTECKRILTRLEILRPLLVMEVGRRLLNGQEAPRPGRGETRAAQLETLIQLLHLADLNAQSALPTRAASLRSQALQTVQRLQSGIFSEMVEDTARSGDPGGALASWQSGLARLTELPFRSESGVSLKTLSPPPGLIRALLEADRPNDILSLLEGEKTKSPAEAEPVYLLASARLAALQGNAPRAGEIARQALETIILHLAKAENGQKSHENGAAPLGRQSLQMVLPALSSLLLSLFMPAEALRAAQIALSFQPNNPEYLILLAKAQCAAGDPQSALEANHLAVALAPTNPYWRRALAENLETVGDWQNALQEREALLDVRFAPRSYTSAPSGGTWPLAGDLRALAACALHADQPQRAVAVCQQALQLNPEDGLAHAILGEALSKTGAAQPALEHFRQATLLAPHQAGPWLALARAQHDAGEAGRAVETLRSAAQAVPHNPRIYLALAETHLEQNALTQAVNVLREAHALLSKQPKAPADNELARQVGLQLGQTLHRLGRLSEARQVLEESYPSHPTHPGLAYAYARTLLALDQNEAALSPLVVALQAEPIDPAPYLDYAATLLKIAAPKNGSSGVLFDSAAPTVLRADFASGERAARRALELAPDASSPYHALANALLAETLLADERPEEALPAYSRALDSELVNDSRWYSRLSFGLARAALKLGQAETAMAALQEAIRAEPKNTRLYRLLAETCISVHLPEEALQAARAAVQSAPDDVDTLKWFAELAMQVGEPDEALSILSRAMELEPNDISLIVRLAQVRTKTGESRAAQESYRQIIAAKTPKPEELRQAAEGLLALGDLSGAIAGLERALALLAVPDAALLYQLATVYRQEGNLERALQFLDHAISLDANNVAGYLCRAEILLSLGRLQAAQASLEHALNLRPDDPYIHYHLATLLRAAGNLNQALSHAQQMVNLLHKNAEADHAPGMLIARTLAGELARARLDSDYARTFSVEMNDEWLIAAYQQVIAEDAKSSSPICDPAQRSRLGATNAVVSYLCLFGELALEIDDEKPALKALEICARLPGDGQLLSSHPRLLALQSRLAFRRGDLASCEQAFQRALQSLPTLSEEGGVPNFSSFADVCAVALAANRTHRWKIALELLQRAAQTAPLEPFSHLQIAVTLVTRAEYQQLCRELEIVAHAPGEESLSQNAYQTHLEAMSAAMRCFPEADRQTLDKTHPQISRWHIRGQAVFRPGPESLQAISSLPESADDLAARIAALYHASEMGTVIQIHKAHAGDPIMQRPHLLVHLAIALGFKGRRIADLGDATSAARSLIERYPTQTIPHYLMANLAQRAGNLETALQFAQTAISLWPDEPRWHTFFARLLLSANEPAVALEHLNKAIELEPRHVSHHLAMGEAYLQSGEIAQAVHVLEEALHLAPDQVEPYLALARAYFQSDDLAKAAISAERAITLSPGQISPLLLRAEIALEAQDPRGALNRAQAALRIDPDEVDALMIASHALCRLGRIPEALAIIEKAIPAVADPLPLLLKRVNLLEKSQGKEAAFAALQELTAQYPREPSVLAPLARMLAEKGQTESAIRAAQIAFHAEHFDLDLEESARLHSLLAGLLRQSGQLDQAIHEYSEAIRLIPTDVETYLELGALYQERRQHALALQTYQRAIAAAANDARPYFQAGLALKESRDYAGAERMLRRAAGLARDDVNIPRTLAAVTALRLIHERRSPSLEASNPK